MNLGPIKDRTKKSAPIWQKLGKRGTYAVAFVCLAAIGIIAALSIPGDNQELSRPTVTPNATATRRPATQSPTGGPTDPPVNAPGTVIVPPPETMHSPVSNTRLVRGYVTDTLVFSDTLSQWSTHCGVDIVCSQGDSVFSVLDGTVESAESDRLMGNTVIIDHGEGLKTVYSSLESICDLKAGDKVLRGAVIGQAGNTALCEYADGIHLHFEVLKNGLYQDPTEYFDNLTK